MLKDMRFLHEKKRNHHKITMLTCYDYPTAVLQEQAGIDVIFVGDSLGTNVLGYSSEVFVTLEDMIHHLKAVRRAVSESYLLVDMPYHTYETSEMAVSTAEALLAHGAAGVKLEGTHPEIVLALQQRGIEVWCHLGFNPQYHSKVAVQGKTFLAAREMVENALKLQAAGASMLVLELVPEELAKLITEQLVIPTIGIGAGRFTDGQVLIVQDMLGINEHPMRHSKNFEELGESMLRGFQQYALEVSACEFPKPGNARSMKVEEKLLLEDWINLM